MAGRQNIKASAYIFSSNQESLIVESTYPDTYIKLLSRTSYLANTYNEPVYIASTRNSLSLVQSNVVLGEFYYDSNLQQPIFNQRGIANIDTINVNTLNVLDETVYNIPIIINQTSNAHFITFNDNRQSWSIIGVQDTQLESSNIRLSLIPNTGNSIFSFKDSASNDVFLIQQSNIDPYLQTLAPLGLYVVPNSNYALDTDHPVRFQSTVNVTGRNAMVASNANVRTIVLKDFNQGSDHQYSGFGIDNDDIVYQLPSTFLLGHSFRAATSGNNSIELMRITSDAYNRSVVSIGSPIINNKTLNVGGDVYISSNVGIGTIVAKKTLDVQGDINFAGSLYQNNSLYISSQWTSNTSANSLYYNGSVGIGSTQPRSALDVNGTIHSTNLIINNSIVTSNLTVLGTETIINTYTTYSSNLVIDNQLGTGPALVVLQKGVGNQYAIADFYDRDISTTVPALRVADGGNVGIGTATPVQSLHIQGGIYASRSIGIGSTQPLAPLHVQGNAIITGSSIGLGTSKPLVPIHLEGISYHSSSVGIGTTNPTVTLSIGRGQTDTTSTLMFNSADTVTNTDKLYWTYEKNGSRIGHNEGWNVNHYAGRSNTTAAFNNGNFHFFTGGIEYNERFTILNNGNIGISSTQPIGTLDVNGTAFTTSVGIGTKIALKPLHVQGQAYISSSVGIGTTIAKKTLDVQGDINFAGSLYQNNSLYISSQWTSNNSTNSLYYNGSVGIGSTQPTNALDVSGNILGANLTITNNIITSNITVLGNQTILNTSTTSNLVIDNLSSLGPALKVLQKGDGPNYPIADFYDRDVSTTIPALRIADKGSIGIGTATPLQSLHVQGSAYISNNVGIGSTQPTTALDVAGTIRGTALTGGLITDSISTISSTIAASATAVKSAFDNGSNAIINANSRVLKVGDTMTGNLLVNANIGINTATPLQPLHVQGQAYITGNMGIGTTLAKKTLDVQGDINFAGSLYQNNSLYISSQWTSNNTTNSLYYNGSVGIGSTQPTVALDVVGTIRATNLAINNSIITSNLTVLGTETIVNTYTTYSSNLVIDNQLGTGPALLVLQKGIGNEYPIADFYDRDVSTTVPALRIADGGYIGIGTATPVQPLHIQGNTYISSNVGIGTTTPLQSLHVQGNIYSSGSLGIGTAIPNGIIDVETNVGIVEFPPSALNQNTITLYNYYGSGSYTASSSSFTSTSFSAYVAFNKSFNNSGGWVSLSSAGFQYNTANGVYAGTSTLDGIIYGEWLKIQLPSPMILKSHTIWPRTTSITTASPKTFYVFGSMNNTTWVDLTGPITANNWTSGAISQSWNITNNNYYQYYAIVITVTGNSGATTAPTVQIGEWVLYGIPSPYPVLQGGFSNMLLVNSVGIGETNPVSALDTGKVRLYNNNPWGSITLARSDGDHNLFIEGVTGTSQMRLRNSSGTNGGCAITLNDGLFFFVNSSSTERMRINTSGSVGIGTTNPLQLLHVQDNVYITNNLGIGIPGSNAFVPLTVYGQAYISSNVGIGTTIAKKTLDVQGDINFAGSLYQNNSLYISSQWTSNNTTNSLYYNGSVGIGSTQPQSALDVSGTIRGTNLSIKDSILTSNLTVLGTQTIINTYTTYSSNLVIDNQSGIGPALMVLQKGSGNQYAIADFYDRDVSTTIPALRVADGGSVGIGTSTPQQQLHIEGKTYTSGSVGIGTTIPLYKMDVIGTTYTTKLFVNQRAYGNFDINLPTDGSIGSTGLDRGYIKFPSTGFDTQIGGQNVSILTASLGTINNTRVYVNTLGSVGIGTTTLTHKLHIYSASTTDNDYESAGILLENATAGETAIAFRNSNVNAAGNVWFMGLNSNSTRFDIGYGTQSSQLSDTSVDISINTSGNVGIGTTIAKKTLDVQGDINFAGSLYQNNGLYISSQWTSNNTANSLYYLGSVGIGSTQPTNALDVSGNILGANLTIVNDIITSNLTVLGTQTTFNTSSTSNLVIDNLSGLGPALKVLQKGDGPNYSIADFYDRDVSTTIPAFRIADKGSIGIGTATPLQSLHVQGSTYITNNLGIGLAGSNTIVPLTVYGQAYISSNVGIGTTISKKTLDVQGDINFSGSLYQNNSLYISSQWTSNLSSNSLYYTGSVGIGTTNPRHKLHIYSASTTDNDYESTGILLDNATTGEAGIAFRNANIGTNAWVMGLNSNSTRFDIAYGSQATQINTGDVKLSLDTAGTLTTSNLVVLGQVALAPGALNTNIQVKPTRQTFYVSGSTQSAFTVLVNGLYGGEASNIQVYLGQKLLTYYTATYKDYDVSLDYPSGSITQYTITLTTPAVYGDFVDITVWPQLLPTSISSGSVYQNITFSNLPTYVTNNYSTLFNQGSFGNIYTSSNVGIGTTVPNKTLDVQGDINFAGNLYQNNSLYISSQWTSNNTSNSLYYLGSVGIGSTQPTSALDLQKIRLVNSSTFGAITLARGFDGGHNFFIEGTSGSTIFRLRNNSGGNGGCAINLIDTALVFNVASSSTERMRITSSGSVGIGTTNPLQLLHVQDNVYITNNVGIGTSIPQQQLHVQGLAYISSNVGIGTTQPRVSLDVFGTAFISSVGIGTNTALRPLHVQGLAYISSNIGIGTTQALATIHVQGNSLMGSGTNGTDITTNGGPFFKQSSWDNAGTTHTITYPSYCQGDNSAGTISIQVSNKVNNSLTSKIGNLMVSFIKQYNTNVALFTICNHKSTTLTTLTVSTSTNNIVIGTDIDCSISWTSTGSY